MLPEAVPALATPGPGLVEDVEATIELVAQRGYALERERLAKLCRGGGRAVVDVDAVVSGSPRLAVTHGYVHPAGRADLAARARARARTHRVHAPAWEPVLEAYARSLARHCPWVRAILASGSLSSGGFREDDDLDVSLLAEDDAKHLTYLVALAVAVPFAWRHRHKPHERTARTPFLPKLVCVNVVWTDGETRPFERTDAPMALEVLLSRPLLGAQAWRTVLDRNPALAAHFPQLSHPLPGDAAQRRRPPRSRLARVLAHAAPPATRRRRGLDAVAYRVARAVHAFVRWSRRHDPAARAHVQRQDALKHPYAILDRPRNGP